VVDTAGVDVELLVVPDCPNEQGAARLLRTALDDVGLADVLFTTTVIDTQELAEERGFTGSPTIMLAGRDAFADTDRQPALACRSYPSATGPAGVPALRDLRQAIKRAADTTGDQYARHRHHH